MSLKFACLAALGAAVFALPAAAHTGDAAAVNCPQARADLAKNLDLEMQALNSQLEAMNEVLAREQEARTEVMDRIKAEVDLAVHTARLDPADIDAIVQRAVVQAEASAETARQAQLAIEAIQPRLQAIEDKIDALGDDVADADVDADSDTAQN